MSVIYANARSHLASLHRIFVEKAEVWLMHCVSKLASYPLPSWSQVNSQVIWQQFPLSPPPPGPSGETYRGLRPTAFHYWTPHKFPLGKNVVLRETFAKMVWHAGYSQEQGSVCALGLGLGLGIGLGSRVVPKMGAKIAQKFGPTWA